MKNLDPHGNRPRISRQVSYILDRLEDKDLGLDDLKKLKERSAITSQLARDEYLFMQWRKEKQEDPDVGSTARKYERTFAANAATRRAANARSGPVPVEEFDEFDTEDGDEPAA